MYLKFNLSSTMRNAALALLISAPAVGFAQIDSYEIGDMGYLRTPMETANGIMVTNNHYSGIYAVEGEQLTPILQGNNCGLYTNLSKDGKYIGYKAFNDRDEQAPAILDVTTGITTLLEDYSWECGQVSFADDGTIAYTMGNTLIVRKGNTRKAFDLGFYTNIANISPDASQVAYSNIDGRMFVINLTTGAKEVVPVVDGYRAHWSPDGTKMAIQTAVGTLAVQDRTNKCVYELGQGESVSWANNSEQLIYTKTDRVNEFEVAGSSIQKINFDGTGAITLVKSSDNLPTDAIITSDNKLLIPYKTGAKRGLMVKNLTEGITPSAASVKEETMLTIDQDDVFGSRISDPNDSPNIKPSPVPAEGSIGALDIPYLSQVYDSPAVNGCTRHGYVTCAPTTACMFLGYYDMLPQKTTYRRSDGTALKYAHAISAVFTSKSGGTTFSLTAYGNGCYNVPGGYGYMWNGSRSPGGGYMASFMKLNGCTSADYLWSSGSAWTKFCSESTAGRPSPLCIALDSGGHLILGFRTNCYYRTSEGGFVARTGTFVCHDPYGDDNDATWADDDGQHSSYDWVGYNSGRANIGTYYWSIYATVPVATTPVEAKITCNPSTVTLKTVYESSNKPYVDVKVTATGLSKNMSVNSINSTVTIEKLSGWNDLSGGTLRVTINPNYTLGMGAYAGYIAVQSGSGDAMVRQEIITDISITDADGNIPSKEEPVAPNDTVTEPGTNPGTETPNVSAGLTKVWQNTTVPGTSSGGEIRFAAVSNGKLIAVDKANLKIIELSETGQSDYYNCSSALSTHWSATSMGPAIGCDDAGNILVHTGWSGATSGSNFMLISADLKSTYKIDLSTIDGYTAARVDQIGRIRGNMLSSEGGYAFITPKDANSVLIVKIANGAIVSDYSQVSNNSGLSSAFDTSSLAQPSLATVAEIDALMDNDSDLSNSFFMRKRGNPSEVFGWNSDVSAMETKHKFSATSTEGYTTTNASTEGFDWFTLENKNYFIMPLSTDGSTNGRSTAWGIFNQDGELVAYNAENVKSGIGQGMGSIIAVPINNYATYIYHFVAGCVAEKYIYATKATVDVESITIEENIDAPVEYYNLQGMKVAYPQGGIFIKVQGNKVSKVYIK